MNITAGKERPQGRALTVESVDWADWTVFCFELTVYTGILVDEEYESQWK
ncbi:MAG: hypothetical protein ACRC10_04455 [Thermoguttaceae bacterium]